MEFLQDDSDHVLNNSVLLLLKNLNISSTTASHSPAFTVEEQLAVHAAAEGCYYYFVNLKIIIMIMNYLFCYYY